MSKHRKNRPAITSRALRAVTHPALWAVLVVAVAWVVARHFHAESLVTAVLTLVTVKVKWSGVRSPGRTEGARVKGEVEVEVSVGN